MATEKRSIAVVWKNVRKMRSRERQSEIMDWIERSNCDICAVNETGLTGEEYMEVSDGYSWFAANIEWTKGRSGGAGVIIKKGIRCEEMIDKMEDVCLVKIGRSDHKFEWLVGSVYMNCEGVRKEENILKLEYIKAVVWRALDDGLGIMIGGDMNAHIWELDGCENENGRRMKENMNEIGLQILNCVWDGLNEATWYTEEKKFTLDYVCMDGRGLKKVVGASILDLGEVIESDHAAIRVEVEWKGIMGQRKKKKKAQKKRCLNKQKWEVFGRRMNGKEFENMSEMNSMMAKEGCEMEKEENWQEDRRWMTDDVRASINGRKEKNREYRKMRRLYGVTDERTQMAKIRYLHMKDDTQRLICRTLHEHNGMVLQKLKEDGSKKRMFNHIKRLMRKQEQKDTSIKILNSSGIIVNDEQEVVKEVERFWGNLFCTNGKVTLGQKKEMIGNGMTSEGQIFSQQEMSVAIKKMKDNKAADESGVIAEYLKALEVEEVEKLRGLMNGILNGADIPKEWKESRVKLLHKGGRTDELKNYRPIAIINITCKLCMLMVRERIDKWTEDSGMLGEIQGGFRRGRRTEDNLFMLERLIEMVKGRKEEIFVAFLDMEKAYDRVNRKKLFEVMRCYGVHEKLVRLIERIYDGSMVKFELEKVTTGWCKSDSGVRQGCPLSPLLFNIYVRELGKVISNCVHGVKYAVVGKDGVME